MRNVLLIAAALFLASCGKEKAARTRDPDGAGGRCGTNPSRGRLFGAVFGEYRTVCQG